MEIIRDLNHIPFTQSAVAIGKFDGVHRGHRKILRAITSEKEKGLCAVVFSFDPSPGVFFGAVEAGELVTGEEKRQMLEEAGVDYLVEFPFNRESAAIPAPVFLKDILCDKLHMRYIAAGPDVSFGDGGAGNVDLLAGCAATYGYRLSVIGKETLQGRVISSTAIRELLRQARLPEVNAMLGYRYSVTGEVVHGAHLGTGFDMPTLNILPPEEKLLPPKGVYFSDTVIDGIRYHSISNIGVKPTVTGDRVMGVETYVYDFAKDIYGRTVTVELLEFERPEQRFASVEALKEQLGRDKKLGAEYFLQNRRSGTERTV